MNTKVRLNLGSGNDRRPGYINVDNGNCDCDLDWDLENLPLPWEDSSVDEVLALHFMEHLSKDKFIPFMREIYRICKNGALIHIEVPYFLSSNFACDPTHKMPFAERTFNYFDVEEKDDLRALGKIYGWDDIKFRVTTVLDNHRLDPGTNVIVDLITVK